MVGGVGVNHPVRGGGVIAMVLKAVARDAWSYTPDSRDQGVDAGVPEAGGEAEPERFEGRRRVALAEVDATGSHPWPGSDTWR